MMFSQRVITTYAWQYVRNTVKYICKCGHKFTRVNSSRFTMNPFNKMSYEDCVKKYKKENLERIRCCPKCQANVKPQKRK